MFEEIKQALGTTKLISTGHTGGGCINDGEVYNTDDGKVFIKRNGKDEARVMFDGEFKSLEAIALTGAIKCPTPHVVVDNPSGGAVLVMEYVEMSGLRSKAEQLGQQLARMHLHNIEIEKELKKAEGYIGKAEEASGAVTYIDKFGFDVPTCCGFLPQANTWCDDWIIFYTRKLQEQVAFLEKKGGDREMNDLWSHLQLKIPQYFAGLEIKPSLLHGDLWSGNAAENSDGPVIFDPAAFYGHHEYDLGIMKMFGGFGAKFWSSYHNVIPKAKGFSNRMKLYELFHNLNHWNHFGSGYRSGSIQIMRSLI